VVEADPQRLYGPVDLHPQVHPFRVNGLHAGLGNSFHLAKDPGVEGYCIGMIFVHVLADALANLGGERIAHGSCF
jgi:hypothetical protein